MLDQEIARDIIRSKRAVSAAADLGAARAALVACLAGWRGGIVSHATMEAAVLAFELAVRCDEVAKVHERLYQKDPPAAGTQQGDRS